MQLTTGPRYFRSVGKYFKGGFIVRICDSVGWGVTRDVGAEVCIYVYGEVNI